MVVRVAVVVLVCSSFALAQRERFREEDLNKWALLSRIATDFAEFGLTSNQLDELKINDIRLRNKIYSFRGQPSLAAEFLDKVYEVLNDEQEARLHQIMFQRWMNRDDLGTPLKAFAPGEVQHVGAKLKTLKQAQANALPASSVKMQPARIVRVMFLFIVISGPKSSCLHV